MTFGANARRVRRKGTYMEARSRAGTRDIVRNDPESNHCSFEGELGPSEGKRIVSSYHSTKVGGRVSHQSLLSMLV